MNHKIDEMTPCSLFSLLQVPSDIEVSSAKNPWGSDFAPIRRIITECLNAQVKKLIELRLGKELRKEKLIYTCAKSELRARLMSKTRPPIRTKNQSSVSILYRWRAGLKKGRV